MDQTTMEYVQPPLRARLLLRRALAAALCMALLAGCAATSARFSYTDVTAMRTQARRESTALDVQPLHTPGISALLKRIDALEAVGDLYAADRELGRALEYAPQDPLLIQRQAELRLQQGEDRQAIALAQHSFDLGPRAGPLCARNFLTIAMASKRLGLRQQRAQADRARTDCSPPKRVTY